MVTPEPGAEVQGGPSLRRTALVLAAIYLLDPVMVGQGLWSLLIAVVGLVVLLVAAIWATVRGARSRARSRLLRAGMYLLLGVAAVATQAAHLATARSRAEQVISACKAYQAQHGAYPDRLEDLVPAYLRAIPRAKYTLAWGRFTYWNLSSAEEGPHHVLMYVAMPPFGRRLYHLEEERWSALD
jgi:hypothetical protein